MFENRREAGERLAKELLYLKDRNPVVLALPRGGVPIGVEVARALAAPLDLLLVRKIGTPGQPELALGAVIDGERMDFVVNDDIMEMLGLSIDFVRKHAAQEVAEIERRRRLYLTDREHEVLALVAKGFTNKAIGVQLSISDRTVQGHLAHIFSKLQAGSRTEAVMKAVSLGWIQADITRS